MTDMDILSEMIKNTAKVSLPVGKNDNGSVKLTESQAPDSSVTIYGIPSDAIVIKVDKFRSPDTVFAGSKDECKRADYVIIANKGSKKHILYIEMKKSKGLEKEIIKQLSGAMCFVRYCREIGKCFWKEKGFLGEYDDRFVSFAHTSIDKRKTRTGRKKGIHDTPEKLLKIRHTRQIHYSGLVHASAE